MRLAICVALAALGLSSCERSEPADAAESPPPPTLNSIRPSDETALFRAFDEHDKALRDAPNSVAKEAVHNSEDPKLCAVIDHFKEFKNWTAEVISIRAADNNPNHVDVVLSLNGSLGGYLTTAHVEKGSSLYHKITTLKADLLDGADVTISGTVTRATSGMEALGDAAQCAGRSNFDVELTEIAPL